MTKERYFARVAELLRTGHRFATARLLAAEGSVPQREGAAMIVHPGGSIEGTIGGGRFEASVILDAVKLLESGGAVTLPFDIGTTCFPLIFAQGGEPDAVWNNLGRPDQLGESEYFDGTPIADPPQAPSFFLFLWAGDSGSLPVGTTVTLQGVLVDPGSLSPRRASATNAVILNVE